jgi:hypothetical protein
MANLTPDSPATWDGVYQLEIADPVLGGPGGIANSQAQALVNRTAFLLAMITALPATAAPLMNGPVAIVGSGSQLALANHVHQSDTSKASLPLAAWVELNRAAASLLADPDLGLHQGERCTGVPTMLGHLLTACGTLGESLRIFQRYQGLEHEGFELLKHRTGRSIEREYVPHVPLAQDRLLIDYSLAGIIGHIRQLTGLPAVVQEVQFTYAQPSGISEHHRIFQSPIRFSSNRNLIRFDESVLDQALLRANPEVCHQLE